MNFKAAIVSCFVLAGLTQTALAQTSQTSSGTVRGATSDGVAVYRGIPYAAALQWVHANIAQFGGDS